MARRPLRVGGRGGGYRGILSADDALGFSNVPAPTGAPSAQEPVVGREEFAVHPARRHTLPEQLAPDRLDESVVTAEIELGVLVECDGVDLHQTVMGRRLVRTGGLVPDVEATIGEF